MTDRAKEMVFNIVGGLIPGKHILDLYAGSGSLGLEALSRGALDVIFVDRADWATRVIRRNLDELKLVDKAVVMETDVFRAIDKFQKRAIGFSLIFVDPPFNKGLVKKTLLKLDQSGIVLPFGQVIVGYSQHEEFPEDLPTLKLARTKKIGQSCYSFLFRLGSNHGQTKSYISGEL